LGSPLGGLGISPGATWAWDLLWGAWDLPWAPWASGPPWGCLGLGSRLGVLGISPGFIGLGVLPGAAWNLAWDLPCGASACAWILAWVHPCAVWAFALIIACDLLWRASACPWNLAWDLPCRASAWNLAWDLPCGAWACAWNIAWDLLWRAWDLPWGCLGLGSFLRWLGISPGGLGLSRACPVSSTSTGRDATTRSKSFKAARTFSTRTSQTSHRGVYSSSWLCMRGTNLNGSCTGRDIEQVK
jgi:hypothetical protein